MKKVFITGISGLLGSNLVYELLDKGYHVQAVIRNPNKYFGKQTPNLKLIQSDLFGDFSSYLSNAEIVIHAAAETATNLLEYEDYDKINYRATIKLFEESKKQNVKQFIFISSANTIGYGSLKHLGNETFNIKYPFSDLFYAQSKLKAEKYLQENRNGIILKILNPTFMIGANDSKPSSGKIILIGLNRKFLFFPPGGKNFVAVKDVISAIINSFEFGNSGEKYLIAGENLSYHDFFLKLNSISNHKQILLPIPKIGLIVVGYFGNIIRKMKIKTSIGLTNMKVLCVNNYYSNQKSVNQLQINYTPIDDALIQAIEYFKNKNII